MICACGFVGGESPSAGSVCEANDTETQLLARTAANTNRTFAFSISAISSGEINVGAGSGCLQRLENVCQINGDHRLSCCRKMVYRELLFLNTAPRWGGFGAKLT